MSNVPTLTQGTVTISVAEFEALRDAAFLISDKDTTKTIVYFEDNNNFESTRYLRYRLTGESDLVKNIIEINSSMSKKIEELQEANRKLKTAGYFPEKAPEKIEQPKNWFQKLFNT